jgi:prepilin signal peptidase PulO-like enzyme (type II secretory pathway)
MNLHHSIGNFEFVGELAAVVIPLLLHPLPFLLVHRLVAAKHLPVAEYAASHLVVLLVTFLKAFSFPIEDSPLNREQTTLTVILETVSFSLQNRFPRFLAERVTNKGFKANLEGKQKIVGDGGKAESARQLTSGSLVSFVCEAITHC